MVHVPAGDVRPADDPPSIGDFYSEWHLLETDFPDGTAPDDVDRDLIEATLADRRDYPLKADISLTDVDTDAYRDLSLQNAADEAAANIDAILDQYEVPAALRPWVITESGKSRERNVRTRCLTVLEAVEEYECETYADIVDRTDIPKSTLANYMGDDGPLSPCIENPDGEKTYQVTTMGEKALDVPWKAVSDEVDKV